MRATPPSKTPDPLRQEPSLDSDAQSVRDVQSVQGHRGSLRSKLVLSLAAMFAIFLMVDEVVRYKVISPVFADLENAAALRDNNRVIAAIRLESDHLRDVVEQSAAKFDPTELVPLDENDGDTREVYTSMPNVTRAYWAAVVGSDGSRRWIHRGPDIDQSERVDQELLDSIVAALKNIGPHSIDGLVRVTDREALFAYAAAPVELGNRQTTFHFVAGKALGERAIAEIRHRTQVDFSIQIYRKEKLQQELSVWEADENNLVVESPLVGTDRKIIANLFVQVPRDVVRQSQEADAVARNMFVCGVSVALLLLLLLLQRIVVGPLKAIREHTERIAEHGLDAGSLTLARNDEIGALGNAFDHMRDRLADTQNRLADASHAAGMSQVADTVIHNVGNVLTNVNSLIETAADRVDGLRVKPLGKLSARLQEASNDKELRKATPAYLRGFATHLENDKQELSELLQTLAHNVTHIHNVIRDQRRHTFKQVDKTRFSLMEIVSEAIECCRARLDQDKVKVDLPSQEDAEVESDRSLLLQIVINIIGNARHAMWESKCRNPKLKISFFNTERTVRMHISDNGCGMTPETLGRAFEAHFTTRKAGSGLGLHFCAITLKRLGGSIRVQSDGPGKGSEFVIELPLAKNQPEQLPPAMAIAAPVTTQTFEPTL